MKRIQRKRVKGWRMPEGAKYVGRPTRWGNPYTFCAPITLVIQYRAWLLNMRENEPERFKELIEPLRGKDLACWCPLNQPCHADVLIELMGE